MTTAHLNVGRLGGDRYQIAFETDRDWYVEDERQVRHRFTDRDALKPADQLSIDMAD